MLSTPGCAWSVISVTPVSVKVLPSVACRLGAVLGEGRDRGDALGGHLQRVLLRGGADLAGLHGLDAGAAAVDRDDGDVLVPAGRLQRLVGAGRGRLVDRVDEVDRRVLLQQVLHRGAAAVLLAVGHVVPDDPRVGLVADLGLVGHVDPEALQEALVALHVDGHAVGVQVQHGDLGLGGLGAELGLGPLPDQQRRPGSCRWRRWRPTASAGSVGVSSAMTSMPACLALSIAGTMAAESLGVIRKPLAPAEIRFSMAWTWASLSPSCLPANDLQLHALLGGRRLGALLHLHEERVGVGLGDQPDDRLVPATATAAGRGAAAAATGAEGEGGRRAGGQQGGRPAVRACLVHLM